MSGAVPLPRVFTCSATKAAVHNLSKNLAREWAPRRVRVNTLVPGFFLAEQNRKILSPARVAGIKSGQHERVGGPERRLLVIQTGTCACYRVADRAIISSHDYK